MDHNWHVVSIGIDALTGKPGPGVGSISIDIDALTGKPAHYWHVVSIGIDALTGKILFLMAMNRNDHNE